MPRLNRVVIERLHRSDGDPARELERKQAETCAGCSWNGRDWTSTDPAARKCRLGRKFGKRCSQYLEA